MLNGKRVLILTVLIVHRIRNNYICLLNMPGSVVAILYNCGTLVSAILIFIAL